MASFEDVYLVPGLGHRLQSYMGLKDRVSTELTSKEIYNHHPSEYVLDVDKFSDDPNVVVNYLSTRGHELREITISMNKYGLILPPTLGGLPNLRKLTYAIPLYITAETKSIEYTTIQCWQSVEKLLDVLLTTEHTVEEFNVIPGDIIFRTTLAKNVYEDSPMNITTPGIHSTIYTHLRTYPLVREPINVPIKNSLKKVRICLGMLSSKASFYLRKFTTVSDWGFADASDPFILQHF